jgi:predicted transposase/invertase (TIGR01784 family)
VIDFSGRKIREIAFLNSDTQDPLMWRNKQSVVDLLCTDEERDQYIVQMQPARIDCFFKKSQRYAARAYCDQSHIKEIIYLAITRFVVFSDEEEYRSDHLILDAQEVPALNNLSFSFLELPKFNKKPDEFSAPADRWARFFQQAASPSPKELDQMKTSDPILHQAYLALSPSFWSDDYLVVYEREERRARDYCSCMAGAQNKGYQKGKQQARLKSAKEMVEQGVDLKTIQQCAKLSDEEMASLETFEDIREEPSTEERIYDDVRFYDSKRGRHRTAKVFKWLL